VNPDVPADRRASWSAIWPSVLIGGAILWAGATTEIDLTRLAEAGGRMGAFLARMLPPDLSVMPEVADATLETLRIAILGTLGCVIASAGLGLLAAETLTPRWVSAPVKLLLALIRAIPLILVAMLMVGAVGLGPLPGVLAIAFHATGMLAKFYADAIEGVDKAPVMAMESAGATLIQRLRFGIWPQMAPDVLRDTVFRFELNLRESLILGVVGAGGVGFYIQTYVRSFQYEKAATVTIVVALIVLLIEFANTRLRRLMS
jgi:phosphonate transport system permease protein